MKTGQALADYAATLLSDQANTWYMYGNNGHEITEQFIQVKKAQYPDRYDDAHVTELRKHIGAIGYDCSSITDLFVGPDRSANGWLDAAIESGPIISIPNLPGLTVHYNGHMGIYQGDGWVVESRGTWHGIVKTRLDDRPWKNWAKAPGVVYTEDEDMIKYLEKSENVKLWQRALLDAKFDIGMHGADGSFGPDTRDATNQFKKAVGLPIDTPATVTLVEWYAMQAYQMGHFDDGVTQADLDAEKAKTAEAFQTIGILQEEIQGLKVSVASKQEDLFTLKDIERVKAEILARA